MRLNPFRRNKKRRRTTRRYDAVATMDQRLSLGPIADFWRRRGSRFISLILLVSLLWTAWHLFRSDQFYVHNALIVGNTFTPDHKVLEASGLKGLSIFWVNPEQVSASVAGALPDIKSAQVEARLPNSVIIEVDERQPQVVWKSGETTHWVDAEGVVLSATDESEGSLVIVDLREKAVAPGETVDPEAVTTAQRLNALLPEVDRFAYSSDRGIRFVNEEGWPIYVGTSENLARKVQVLKALTAELRREGVDVEVIDLRFERPYYRKK